MNFCTCCDIYWRFEIHLAVPLKQKELLWLSILKNHNLKLKYIIRLRHSICELNFNVIFLQLWVNFKLN